MDRRKNFVVRGGSNQRPYMLGDCLEVRMTARSKLSVLNLEGDIFTEHQYELSCRNNQVVMGESKTFKLEKQVVSWSVQVLLNLSDGTKFPSCISLYILHI